MDRPAKKSTTPDNLQRTWLLSGLFFSLLILAGAVYIHHHTSQLSPQSSIETASLRTYREKKIPELEVTADRQELFDELNRFIAKTERALGHAREIEERSLYFARAIPRLLALFGTLLFLYILIGYGYLRTMRKLAAREALEVEHAPDRP